MSSQINYIMQTDFYTSKSCFQPKSSTATTSFQRKIQLFKPKSNRSYFQIRYKKNQNFKEIRFQKKSFKLKKIIKKAIQRKVPLINPYLSPHNTTQFIINSYENSELLGLRFSNCSDGFGSMMGLVKNDSFNEKPSKTEDSKFSSIEIEEMLQSAKIEQDPFRLFIIINRLANMVKEKDEQILVLEKKISEHQQFTNQ